MPYPQKNEKKADYVSRCVKICMDEGLDQKAALGKCYGMWKTYHGAAKAVKEKKALEVKE